MKITVITVCYNSADTIEQTIQSVLNQTYEDKEYIIIDGGSIDGTLDIIRKYAQQLAYWHSEPDRGLYDAMNKGITYATGDVIAFLNSDDWYEDGILEKVDRYFRQKDTDILGGSIHLILNDRIVSKARVGKAPEDIRVRMIYLHPALFAKRVIFDQIGKFDLQYKIAADYDWVLRAYLAGFFIVAVEDVFTNFRDGGTSMVNLFDTVNEVRKIALSYAGDSQVLRERIEESYTIAMEDGRYVSAYFKVLKREPRYLRRILSCDKQYYIWGTGVWGERCYCLFRKLKLNLIGFIDTNKSQATLHGFPIIEPEEIDDKGIICISSKKYENEIIRKIQLLGIDKERFFCFSQFVLGAWMRNSKEGSNIHV